MEFPFSTYTSFYEPPLPTVDSYTEKRVSLGCLRETVSPAVRSVVKWSYYCDKQCHHCESCMIKYNDLVIIWLWRSLFHLQYRTQNFKRLDRATNGKLLNVFWLPGSILL